MRQVKRNRDSGRALRRKPFIAQIAGRTKRQAMRAEFVVELRDAALELASRNPRAQIADAPLKQFVVS